MERVLVELKRIEDEAEKIHSEASQEYQEIIEIARQKARELTANAENEAKEEVEKFLKEIRAEIEIERHNILQESQKRILDLNALASKNIDSVIDEILKLVAGVKKK